jgi:signal transduction histidine kinase/CheY-like chemotaxis protein
MNDITRTALDWDALSLRIVLVDGESICINSTAERAIGYLRSELTSVDQYVERLLVSEDSDSAADLRKSVDLWRAAKGALLTLPIIRRDGAQIWVEHQVSSYEDQELWILRDVSERVAGERVARKQAELLKRVSRLGELGGWEHILETDEIIWSEQLYRIHEIEPQTRIWSAVIESLYSKEAVARLYEALVQSMKDGAPYDIELPFVTYRGKHRWARMIGEVELENGRPKRWVGIMQDVTERYKTNEALREARLTAEAASRAKSEFLANMSHEIRTPMNGIIGMTELLLLTRLDETQRDYAETVGYSARALLTIINGILDFSKVEAGKLELECLDMDVRDTVHDVGRLLAVQAHAKNLELTIEIDPRIPNLIRGDAGRLRQVLLNLGGNAVKFTRHGEIAVGMKMLPGDSNATILHFEIRDTGIGIPAERIHALFQPFTQVDASTTREFGGTGLGLAIVQRLVHLMGGECGVDSLEGRGSCFWFTAEFGRARKLPLPISAAVFTFANMPVLVVDDNATNRRILAAQLRQFGCEPVCAASADEALLVLRAAAQSRRPFQLALIDHLMPQRDGVDLGREIAADAALRSTRLILLTSSGAHDARQLSELGFSAHLLKPVAPRDLLECLLVTAEASSERWHMQTRPIATTRELAHMGAHKKRRILVAEDNVVNQKVVRKILENMGFHVTIADNGRSAVAMWERHDSDLILMDCQMPELDGYQATAEIRRRENAGNRIPIIALTAHAMKGADTLCVAAGMDGHLTKPIDKKQLEATLARFLPPADAPFVAGSAVGLQGT